MSNTENGFFFSFCFACAKLLKLGHKSNNKLCDSKLLVPGFYVSVLQGALLYEHYAMILVLVLGGGRKKNHHTIYSAVLHDCQEHNKPTTDIWMRIFC